MKKKTIKHESTPDLVRILKTVNADMTAYNGFVWPESGIVTCPDWSPSKTCGNGLHGLLDGYGNSSFLNKSPDAKWLVLEVERSLVVEIDDEKVKVPSANVIYCGDREGAFELLTEEPCRHASQKYASGVSKRISGTASATGDRGAASATGDRGAASATGDRGAASATGDRGTASATGDSGTASATGYSGTASATGDSGTASATGDRGTASATGYSGTASATGDRGTACGLGSDCIVESGTEGILICKWWDRQSNRYRVVVGYVGEDGIKPNTKYKTSATGKLEEVPA
jgi:hypothetical protein